MTHQNSAARQEREPSALVFVAKVIFISIAVVLTIVFLAALPEAPWTPLVIALAIALVLGFSVELALRSRRRDQRPSVVRMAGRRDAAFRRPEDCPAQLDNGRSPLDDGSSDTRPGMVGRVLGLFAAIGALCIVLAFLAPPELGVSLAILGLGGFFIVRLAAFHPRGAWRPPTSLIGVSARRLKPTLYVSLGGRARPRVAATAARKGRLRDYAHRLATARRRGARRTDAQQLHVPAEAGRVQTPWSLAARLGVAPVEEGGPIQAS